VGLHPLDLAIEAGERLALIGPNGSGKTTLARLLATDLSPSGGELDLLGESARRPTPELRRRIGYAGDRPIHWEPLTGAENLRFFWEVGRVRDDEDSSWEERGLIPGASPHPCSDLDSDPDHDSRSRLAPLSVARTLGLGPVLDEPVSRYSFGMRRRLLLSEVLASRAELLLFDEPTVGLDPSGVVAFGRELLARARQGAAVVLATNEVREVPGWATRVLFLSEGRVVADGTPESLLQRVKGRTLVTVRFRTPGADSGGAGEPGVGSGPIGGAHPGSDRAAVPRGVLELLRDDESLVGQGPTSRSDSPEEGPDESDAHSGRGSSSLVTLRVQTPRGARLLPPLLEGLLDSGAEIRDVRVREPDLRDVFRGLTGRELTAEGQGMEPPGGDE
jgi:ABC-2 type transport system ATP-binding protein